MCNDDFVQHRQSLFTAYIIICCIKKEINQNELKTAATSRLKYCYCALPAAFCRCIFIQDVVKLPAADCFAKID